MAVTSNTTQGPTLSIGDPTPQYMSMKDTWRRCRAVLSGESAAKDYDRILDLNTFKNLLIPFSSKMTQEQYNFYKAEAELPGLSSQYLRVLAGGLLRKDPILEFTDQKVADEIKDWILNEFTADNSSLQSFAAQVIQEELETTNSWILVDMEESTGNDAWPYPILYKPENVINHRLKSTTTKGEPAILAKFVTRCYIPVFEDESTPHPTLIEEVRDHYIDASGYWTIDVYHKRDPKTIVHSQGDVVSDFNSNATNKEAAGDSGGFVLVDQKFPMLGGKRITFIPAWPSSGKYGYTDPVLEPVINREVHLYNLMSRRNHLMYGAASYTVIVFSSQLTPEGFTDLAQHGLGTMWHIPDPDAKVETLKPPTESLKDMETAITNKVNELAKMGIRILSPESGESGIALEIRNASQTVQLSSLNTAVSNTLEKVIAFMIYWKYNNIQLQNNDIKFSLSTDFNPSPIGEAWLRLVTEWYESRHISRDTFVHILKQNDILPNDHDDEEEQEKIDKSPMAAMEVSKVKIEE